MNKLIYVLLIVLSTTVSAQTFKLGIGSSYNYSPETWGSNNKAHCTYAGKISETIFSMRSPGGTNIYYPIGIKYVNCYDYNIKAYKMRVIKITNTSIELRK